MRFHNFRWLTSTAEVEYPGLMLRTGVQQIILPPPGHNLLPELLLKAYMGHVNGLIASIETKSFVPL
jgi:hypothetical protein